MKIPNAANARQSQGNGTDEKAGPGVYLMEVRKVREKNGRLLLLWEVAAGESKGAIAWDGYSLDNPKACGILISRLEAIGVEIDDNGFFDEGTVAGKFAEVQLIQNGEYINVKSVKPLDKAMLDQLSLPGIDPTTDADDVPF